MKRVNSILLGTGKSFTISAISNLVRNVYLRCAPTAKAAYLIKGSTLHSTFYLSTSNKEKDLSMDLKGDRLKILQEKFKDKTHVIIDEYSMVSQIMLAQIDKRLRQATGFHDKFFGGLSIILVGDPAQLLPVMGSPLYNYPTKTTMASHGLNCYQQFKHAICLEVCERQKNDLNDPDQEYFIEMLKRIRSGCLDLEQNAKDWNFILKNQISPSNQEEFKDALRLFPDNQSCNEYNFQKLKNICNPITRLEAVNHPKRIRNVNEENFSGLTNNIFLCIGARIMLTSNLWTEKGLVNGANGYIRDILYFSDTEIPNLPSAIFIEFDNYSGPKFFTDTDSRKNWIPINPLSIYCNQNGGSRTQYPIRLAYALTIHKSQGQTLEKVVIDIGKKETTLGLTFVALSRVRKFSDFIIKPFTLQRLNKIRESSCLMLRKNEEERVKIICSRTLNGNINLLN